MRFRSVVLSCAISVTLLLGQTASKGLLADKKVLTISAAKEMAAAAEKKALANGWRNIIAIVDEGGNLVYLERMDDATPGSVEVAMMKTRTAALFHVPTKQLADGLAAGRTVLLKVPNLLPAEGALPIIVDGKVIGAIGVAGGASDQDALVAQEGLNWLNSHLK